MELKVWVDGIQRVVCGINEQTTVQEVVIALAQATGRTGRYTLVEKHSTTEKMLPPSEHPLQVLSNWGEKSADVQFVLRRTGASTSMSEIGDDKVIMPERKTHRSSLPPQFKHKQKKDAILNRKEPKRKSLDITGGGKNEASVRGFKPSVALEKDNDHQKKIDKVAPISPKKALIPPAFLNQSSAEQKLYPIKSDYQQKQNTPMPSSRQIAGAPLSPGKKPLVPPGYRGDVKSTDGQAGKYGLPLRKDRKSSSDNDTPLPTPRPNYEGHNVRSLNQPKILDAMKARAEFTRLVLEQHEHVSEQNQTLKTLDEEMEKCQAMAQRREKSTAMLKKEIEILEKKFRKNEQDLHNEKLLQEELQNEGYKGNALQNESSKYQEEVTSVSENIKEMEKQVYLLQQEIGREKIARARKKEEGIKSRYHSAESEVRKVNNVIGGLLDELKLVEEDIDRTETAFHDKQSHLETLNRELRQVNLQQFIRQTGSKVTVLPPDDDRGNLDSNSSMFNGDNQGESPAMKSSSTSDASGVWV